MYCYDIKIKKKNKKKMYRTETQTVKDAVTTAVNEVYNFDETK